MTIQPTRSTHPPAMPATSTPADGRAAKPSAPPFTRSPVDGGRSGAPISSVKDRNPPPEEMARDVQSILEAASRRMRPGGGMNVKIKDMDMVLYRTMSGDGLVLQSPQDYARGSKFSGLYMGYGDARQLVMSFDMKPVSTMDGNYAFYKRSIASIKDALGFNE